MPARVDQLKVLRRDMRRDARVAELDLHAHQADIDLDFGDPQGESLHVDAWAGGAVLGSQAAGARDLNRGADGLVGRRTEDRGDDQPDGDRAKGQEPADHGLGTALTRYATGRGLALRARYRNSQGRPVAGHPLVG